MKKITTKALTLHAMLLAITTVTTMALAVPVIVTKGYVNLGDAAVILSAWILGPVGGAFVGGSGSALADLLLGYGHYAPITLLVKGLEGWLAAFLFHKLRVSSLLSGFAAGLWMACGYFFAQVILFGVSAALIEAPGNVLQGVTGALFATMLYPLARSVKTGLAR